MSDTLAGYDVTKRAVREAGRHDRGADLEWLTDAAANAVCQISEVALLVNARIDVDPRMVG
jgi:hypothetical protein